MRIDPTTLPSGTSVTTTPATITRTLATGDDVSDADIGIAGTGTIGDRIWYDADADGLDSNGEDGLGGIVVILSDDAGNEIERTTTASDGSYGFDNLPAGDYVVTLDPTSLPAGSTVTFPPPAAAITLPDGLGGTDNTIDTVDIGIAGTTSVGNRVWFDTNGDGVQDPAEIDGVGAVTVRLFDGPGAGATELAVTTTDADGLYAFENLFADTYEVRIDTGSLPGGMTTTTATVVTADVTLSSFVDADFGVTGTNSIGDLVFFDADGSDDQGVNEPGLPGVTLRLLDAAGDPVQIDGADVTAVTVADGLYSFDRLANGTYSVEVVSGLPTGAVADNLGPAQVTLTGGDTVDTQDFAVNGDSSIGDTVFLDADEDGAQAGALEVGGNGIDVVLLDDAGNQLVRTTTAPVAGVDGVYSFPGLIPGDYQVVIDETTLPDTDWSVTTEGSAADPIDITLPAATDVTDADVGITATASIGDQIWVDANSDGVRNVGENNWTGAPITLALLDSGGAQITTTTTDGSGGYSFDDVLPGSYQVQVVTGTLPANYSVTSNSPFTVTVGVDAERLDVDFGINAPATINGQLYVDVNDSGTQQAGETVGLAGVGSASSTPATAASSPRRTPPVPAARTASADCSLATTRCGSPASCRAGTR